MKPYYQDSLCTIYHGDCRDVMPELVLPQPATAVITDPVWPNAAADFAHLGDPAFLLRTALRQMTFPITRLVIQLGCDSDPRFLAAVPAELPFLRSVLLEYAVPGYKGRLLNNGDVAYVFGGWPESHVGRHLISGLVKQRVVEQMPDHPTPRRYEHVKWLVGHLSDADETVLDPFMGSGTALLAAKYFGRRAIGIEIEERYCEIAAKRLSQETLGLDVA